MYAIEFETSITNGIIHIPPLFKKLHHSAKAKIIILVDETDRLPIHESDFIDQLIDNPRPMNSTTFLSREEANAR